MGNSNMYHSNESNIIKSSGGVVVSGPSDRAVASVLDNGTLIDGRYRIISFIGDGSMGVLYQVLDEQLKDDKVYAIKINIPEVTESSAELLLAGIQECQNVHLAKPVALGYDKILDTEYVVMDYIEGESLATICKRVGYLSEVECLTVAYEVCQALQSLEVWNILHCDIKPSNIMLGEDGILRLTDFGSSICLKRHDEPSRRPSPQALPQNGTPLYESPEQWRRKPSIDSRSDIYGLGATLYDLATGRHAFPGETTNEVFAYRAKHPVPAVTPRRANPSLSREFSELIMNMMAADPEDRPGTSSYLLETMLELGCPEYEEDRTEIMRNLLTRKPSMPLPPPKKDFSGIIQNILRFVGIILLIVILIWACLK